MPSSAPPVVLVPAPDRGVWRLGKAGNPLRANQVEPETVEGSAAGRFSLLTYRTLYCASDLAGCFAEGLAPFRVDHRLRHLIASDIDAPRPGQMQIGHLPSSWRSERILVRLKPAATARFLDVDAEQTRAVLADQLRSELKALGVDPPLTDKHIHGYDRRIARQIAAWSVAQRKSDGHQLVQGIAYRSGYGGRRCWAILGDTELTEEERRPIPPEQVELQEVAREYGLTVF
jgi:hypothetical protein